MTRRASGSTIDTYRFWLEKVVLPGLAELQLIECDVGVLDAWFDRLARERRTVKHKDGSATDKPTQERHRLLDHVDKDPVAIAPDLPDLVRFAIGTGLRIGEICAVRWMDVNLDGLVVVNKDDMRLVPVDRGPPERVPVKGKGLAVHGGKTSMALRIVPLPDFVVDSLRARRIGDEPPERPVVASAGRDGRPTCRWPSTADLLGQSEFLKDTNVSRGELHPDAAVFLDAAIR